MNRLRVSVVQTASGDDVGANLLNVRASLNAAAADGARLAVLPENFAAMGADETLRVSLAEVDGHGPIQSFLADTAARLGIWIVGGALPLKSDDPARPFSSCVVYDDAGQRRGRFDKLHLFDVDVPETDERYRESTSTMPGDRALRIDTPWGGLTVAICYDLRFPEVFRYPTDYELLALPAAFTRPTGMAHWHALLRARAIENQCFVLAAAQTGRHPGGRETYGHSLVCGPWGEVLAELTDAPGQVCADLDFDELADQRARFPALRHRRPEIDEHGPVEVERRKT
jgi:predicted amidohydrolase